MPFAGDVCLDWRARSAPTISKARCPLRASLGEFEKRQRLPLEQRGKYNENAGSGEVRGKRYGASLGAKQGAG